VCITFDEATQQVCDTDWNCTSVDEALSLYFDGAREDWNNGEDFDYEDWESNFDMNSDSWWLNYDFSVIFPVTEEINGTEYYCEASFSSCWTFDEYTQEACTPEGECYPVIEALRVHFEGDLENWNNGEDFDWSDWESNFDMDSDSWWSNYDWTVIFPHVEEIQGAYFACDNFDICVTFDEATQQICDLDWNCLPVKDALRNYFEGERENWNNGADFDYEDWESNFDMNSDSWWLNYDFSAIFPNREEINGREFYCDATNVSCWTFDESTQEACDLDWNCYSPYEALRVYFEGNLENWNHG